MKFLKENSYDIVKFYITQLGISIFSHIMYHAGGAIGADSGITATIGICISVFAIVFYFFLLYTAAWDFGAKDKIRIDGGRMEPQKAKLLLMSLIANSLNLLLVLASTTGFALALSGVGGVALPIATIALLILQYTAGMFQGVINYSFTFLKVEGQPSYEFYLAAAISYLVCILLSIAITHFAYYMGSKDRKIFSFIKSNKKYE